MKTLNISIFSILLTATLVVSGFFIFINKAQAEILYVCPEISGECTHVSIQVAIDAANEEEEDIINVASGSYTETLDINKSLTIQGESKTKVIIDASGSSDYGITITANNVSVSGLTLIGPDNYGFKISHVDDITLENIKVENSHKTGIDLNTVNDAILNNIEVINTVSGFGLMILDSEDIFVTDITTSNNAWGGVSVQTKNAISDSISFSGIFDVQEDMPFLLEQDPDGSNNYYDITNVQIPDKFNYVVYDFREGDDYKQWYYFETLDDSKTIAQAFIDSKSPVYSDIIIYNIAEDNYYVIEGMLIQDAIDAASDGDTINVAAGIYDLDSPIVVDKSLTLTGDTTTPSNVVVNAPLTEGLYDRDCFQVIANNVTIQGFKIVGAQDCREGDVPCWAESGRQNAGIMVGSEATLTTHGPYLGISDGTFSYNEFVDCSKGIFLYHVKNSEISYNTFTTTEGQNPDNFYDTLVWNGDGIHVYLELASNYSTGNTISHNTMDNVRVGIFLNGDTICKADTNPSAWDFQGTTIEGNTMTDVWNAGIILQCASGTAGGGTPITIKDNNIATSTGRRTGDEGNERGLISVKGDYTEITGNTLNNSEEHGIWVDGSHHTVTGNTVHSNTKDGIHVGWYKETEPNQGWTLPNIGRTDITINLNSIYSNIEDGLDGIQADEEIDAKSNYWGSVDGPTHASNPGVNGDAVSDNVDFKPWYANSEMTSLKAPTTTDPVTSDTVLELEQSIDIISNDIIVSMPAGITITATASWEGIINTPTIELVASDTPSPESGYNTVVDTVIEIGYPDTKLVFNKAVRILIPDQAGKKVGYTRTGEPFTEITNFCLDDIQEINDDLPPEGDCKIDVDNDLAVWTKHFTQFIVYSYSPIIITPTFRAETLPEEEPSPLSEEAQKLDTNKDDKIDDLDLKELFENWGSTILDNIADFNDDSKVDVFDFNLLMVHWTE